MLAAALLVGLTASSAPFLSTAAGSAALKNRLNELDPLTTGIEIQRDGGAARGQSASAVQKRLDAGVAAVAARVGSLGAPVKTLELPDGGATDSKGNGFAEIHIMARSGVLDHVKVLARVPGPGLVIADTTAKALHVHPGGSIRLQTTSIDGEPSKFVPVRVAGTYRALAYEPEEPYWANFVAKIYPANPDAPVPTPFAFVSRGGLLDLGAKLGTGGYQATDELPVDPRHLTLPGGACTRQTRRSAEHGADGGQDRPRPADRLPVCRRQLAHGGDHAGRRQHQRDLARGDAALGHRDRDRPGGGGHRRGVRGAAKADRSGVDGRPW